MNIDGFDLRNLHDAVLQEISVKWGAKASVEFDLRPNEAYVKPSRPVVMRCEGLTRLVCPQQNPWGPSDYVNGVSIEAVGGGTRVSVEMQSGDVIVVEGESINIVTESNGHDGT